MQRNAIKKYVLNTFWLSLLFHLLILLYLIYLMSSSPNAEQKQLLPHHYVPAYTYTGSIKPSFSSRNKVKSTQTQAHQSTIKKMNSTDIKQKIVRNQPIIHLPRSINKKRNEANLSAASLLADSFAMLKEEQMREVTKAEETEPIYLIGDDSQPADPLIKLIGQSLSTHFHYPRMAGQLGIKGRVLIKLTLHPDGYYSDVSIIKSSTHQDLDAAALYAVNKAPQVYGADRFISKPKRMVIGFVFDSRPY